jgi:hypothetical protein
VGTATVSGNGTYHPAAGFTPTTAGTYWWYASYGGDSSNGASNSTCGTGMTSTVAWSESSVASGSSTLGTSVTTSSFTVKPSTTYLLLLFRHSSSGDSVSSISSSGLSPSLTTSSFSAITSQNFNTSDYQWAYYITTASNASGTGTLTINFTQVLASGITLADLVQLGGNNTTTPIVTTNEGKASGSGTTATANLPSAPGAQDAEVVFLTGNGNLGGSAPVATGLSNLFYSHQSTGSAGTYSAIPAQQNSSFTISSQPWGTIALEINHG